MADLHWTMPITRWASISASDNVDVRFIEPMMRRRLSGLSRLALQAADNCAGDRAALRMVFASRHGELTRTTALLDAIASGEPVSPTAFGLSVLNAASGMFGIVRRDRSAATALSSGNETLGYALLEAHAQAESGPACAPPVLLVYADEPANDLNDLYAAHDDIADSEALAILIDGTDARGDLHCEMTAGDGTDAGAAGAACATQSAALRHCLNGQGAAIWRGRDATWRWSWHDRAA
ncbi:beta-ketoacyl synthase chain length factor [Burkholderia sp. 22PA0106]|uniref:beta-ketoacyl synthase chain length factor n=1 Tax=Burkholderia sp. 22PA0106 TaxID=3237371 RepID=UPI0039C0E17C